MSENCRKCAGRLVAAKLQTLTELARLARFERATAWFVAQQLTNAFCPMNRSKKWYGFAL